jgi:protein phosphatase
LAIALRYAARSDVGLVRRRNDDSGYAGPHLLVVADGMGGHAGGDVASSLAIGELAALDGESHGRDALDLLSQAVHAAHRELLSRVAEEPQLAGMGTTVTALLRTGNRLALAHIGDSRAYVLREGALAQITKDHTFVQTLVDEGRLTTQEAEQHPQRSVLMRVLSDVVDDVQPDMSVREARVGDRYLLCSDGLSGVVSFETLQETLAEGGDPASTTETLVQLALRGGAPDNVTCIVADVVDEATLADVAPAVVGSASLSQPARPAPSAGGGSAAERAAALTTPSDGGTNGETTTMSAVGARPAGGTRMWRRALGGLVVAAVLVGGGLAAWQWIQRQYFVGDHEGSVAIYRGLRQDVGPLRLAEVEQVASDVPVTDLPAYQQDLVRSGIVADTPDKARAVLQNLREAAASCRTGTTSASPSPSVSPTPPVTPSITPTPTVSVSASSGAVVTPTVAAAALPSVTPTATASPGASGTAPSATATPSATVSPSATVTPSPPPGDPAQGCGATTP